MSLYIRCPECDKSLYSGQELDQREGAWQRLFFYFQFQFNQGYITEDTFSTLIRELGWLDRSWDKEKCETNSGHIESDKS